MILDISQKILSKNDIKANELRKIYKKDNVFVLNFMSSPGSGKTTLLESMAEFREFKFCVIEGDLETNRDAQRLSKRRIPAYQITTGDACHLEASMIEKAYLELKDKNELRDYLIIENVGNLVCPASYDLGANLKVVLLSTPEGDDKVLKYPSMFLCADIIVITKSDIASFFNFNIENVKNDLSKINPKAKLFILNNKDKVAIKSFIEYIKECKTSKE
ncbi:hydrogenase nickel incorporation protein HypB [Helicobacter sp. MIT 14-3879]|uniref:hydrogenase nickel incorporation protein HypB n=1 Tax=Helicobacter sp. MIT 14-3879 TaxID=2040649 RepID=UPI000E1F9721|nr:hydrogenase nickel incorporation protein HypB [Helicobacter sp. MIT 14-3879]RDU64017.1 hydrogenase accessory protein HypB [Helicobacter sp. MIT 14-3879]